MMFLAFLFQFGWPLLCIVILQRYATIYLKGIASADKPDHKITPASPWFFFDRAVRAPLRKWTFYSAGILLLFYIANFAFFYVVSGSYPYYADIVFHFAFETIKAVATILLGLAAMVYWFLPVCKSPALLALSSYIAGWIVRVYLRVMLGWILDLVDGPGRSGVITITIMSECGVVLLAWFLLRSAWKQGSRRIPYILAVGAALLILQLGLNLSLAKSLNPVPDWQYNWDQLVSMLMYGSALLIFAFFLLKFVWRRTRRVTPFGFFLPDPEDPELTSRIRLLGGKVALRRGTFLYLAASAACVFGGCMLVHPTFNSRFRDDWATALLTPPLLLAKLLGPIDYFSRYWGMSSAFILLPAFMTYFGVFLYPIRYYANTPTPQRRRVAVYVFLAFCCLHLMLIGFTSPY